MITSTTQNGITQINMNYAETTSPINFVIIFNILTAIVKFAKRIAKNPFSRFNWTQGSYELSLVVKPASNKASEIISTIGFTIGSLVK